MAGDVCTRKDTISTQPENSRYQQPLNKEQGEEHKTKQVRRYQCRSERLMTETRNPAGDGTELWESSTQAYPFKDGC